MFTIFLQVANLVYGQIDSLTISFLSQVLQRKSDSIVLVYSDKEHQNSFGSNAQPEKRSKNVSKKSSASISLSAKEYKFIKQQWKMNQGFVWADSLLFNSKRIAFDSVYHFLSKDKSRVVYQFSKPIFIRNYTVALIHLTRLCCGGIYGPDNLVYYKREGNGWKRWIYVNQAEY